MPSFEVKVRLLNVDEHDAWGARRAVEQRLRAAGFERWQIVNLRPQEIVPLPRNPVRRRSQTDASVGGGLLVAAAVAWTLWFWWTLF